VKFKGERQVGPYPRPRREALRASSAGWHLVPARPAL
jgi:hypothetical protein